MVSADTLASSSGALSEEISRRHADFPRLHIPAGVS